MLDLLKNGSTENGIAIAHYHHQHHGSSHLHFGGPQLLQVSTTTVNPFENNSSTVKANWEVALQGGSLAVIGLLSLLGNFLVTFSLVRREQLHFPSNRLVFNLTAANFAFSLLVLPFVIASVAEQKWIFGIFWCNFTAFLTLLNGCASVITLAMISIDRYYAIVKPMAYNVTITSSKSTAMLLWVWIQACSCSLPPLFGWSKFEYQEGQSTCMVAWWDNRYYSAFLLTSCVFLPFSIMVTCYHFIYQVALKKSRKISVGSLNSTPGTDVEGSVAVVTGIQPLERTWPRYRRLSNTKRQSLTLLSYHLMTKGAWTICIVVGAFVITWIPQAVLAVWESVCGYDCAPRWFKVSSTWMMYAGGVSYPIVYGLYNRAIRKEMIAWLYHPNVKNAMKGLPSRCSRRGSFTNSILDYSPFRFRSPLKKSTVNLRSRASIDLGILALTNTALRKTSQDSGTVMTDSDMENTQPGFWSRRRHSASNVFRCQSQKRESAASVHKDSFPLPILRMISMSDAEADQDNSITGQDVMTRLDENNLNGCSADMTPISGAVALDMDDQHEQHLFHVKTGFERQRRGASVDEGIVNDCVVEDV